MINGFQDFQKFGQSNVDSALKMFAIGTRGGRPSLPR